MDSYRLKEEQAELQKSITDLKHIKEVMDERVKILHNEEMRYLQEMPEFQRLAKNAREKMEEEHKLLATIYSQTRLAEQKLLNIQNSIAIEEKALIDLKFTQENIIKETKQINEQLDIRFRKLKEAEQIMSARDFKNREYENRNESKEIDLDSKESSFIKKDKEHSDRVERLSDEIENHKSHIDSHQNNIQLFSERKRFFEQDEQLLRDKLGKADKLVKDQSELKIKLLMQAQKLEKEIELCKQKQDSLDKHNSDLKHQEDILKIKELKIIKMAKEAGIEKELRELQEQIK